MLPGAQCSQFLKALVALKKLGIGDERVLGQETVGGKSAPSTWTASVAWLARSRTWACSSCALLASKLHWPSARALRSRSDELQHPLVTVLSLGHLDQSGKQPRPVETRCEDSYRLVHLPGRDQQPRCIDQGSNGAGVAAEGEPVADGRAEPRVGGGLGPAGVGLVGGATLFFFSCSGCAASRQPVPALDPAPPPGRNPRGQGLRLRPPAKMTALEADRAAHCPPRHRTVRPSGPAPLGGRAHDVLTERLPSPAPTLRSARPSTSSPSWAWPVP